MDKKDVLLTIGGLGALYLLNKVGGQLSVGSMSSALLGALPHTGNPIVDLASRQAADAVAQAMCSDRPRAVKPAKPSKVILNGKEAVIRDAEWVPIPPADRTST